MILTLLSLSALCAASSSQAALYVGGGDRVRVEFRTENDELVWASVSARLYCTAPHGERHFNVYWEHFASAAFPLEIDRDGRFQKHDREDGFLEQEVSPTGRVGAEAVVGRVQYRFRYFTADGKTECQTRSYPPARQRAVPFRARLKPPAGSGRELALTSDAGEPYGREHAADRERRAGGPGEEDVAGQ